MHMHNLKKLTSITEKLNKLKNMTCPKQMPSNIPMMTDPAAISKNQK